MTRSVPGSTRATVPLPLLATHTDPAPKATPRGLLPTPIVVVTDPVAGSIRVSVSARVFATQTLPAPTAIPLAPGPTGMTAVTAPLESILDTVSSASSATHVPPSPIAIPLGSLPTSILESFSPPAAIRTTWDALLATHVTPSPTAITLGLPPVNTRSPSTTRSTTSLKVGSTREATPRVESSVHNARESAATASTLPPTGRLRRTVRDVGLMFEIVWSSVLATHTPPMPAVMLSGATPTGVSATTRSVWGSMTATEFAAAVSRLAPPPVSATAAAAIAAASSSAPPATMSAPPRARALAGRARCRDDGASSAGSCARIARSSS